MEIKKNVLFDVSYLTSFCKNNKLQDYRQKQIIYEIFKNQNISIDDMTTLPKDLRDLLKTNFDVVNLEQVSCKEDNETTKFGFRTKDGYLIETVLIYHWHKIDNSHLKKLNRITICVSSQVGCSVGCVFCVTGKLGIKRNLTYEEIISQILIANNYVKSIFGKKDDGTINKIRNVVFMGMGEPLLNYDNLIKSLNFLLDQKFLSLSKRHVTISTCGITPGINRLIEDKIDVKLALSLHGPYQELREELIPMAKQFPLKDLMQTIDKYVEETNNRIFYEYIMIKGKTDTLKCAKGLIDLLSGRLAHLNLIPYNDNPAIHNLEESDLDVIRNFKSMLENGGITVTVRDSMGRQVKSACGQLGYEFVNQNKN